jgi:ubiquitin carboxyl-terminal hydrolase 25
MTHKIDSKHLQEIIDMGISHEQAVKALKLYKNKEQALNSLFPSPEKPVSQSVDDLAQAIQNSLKEIDSDYQVFDLSNPETHLRSNLIPVGLKNIGNTCYFNSLIQTYFMIPKFIKEILSFKPDPSKVSKNQKTSINLIEQMQFLFGCMILGNKKFIDPSNVLDALVDDFGNKILVGEQKDVGEFNMNLIARIEEGLKCGISSDSQDLNHSDDFKGFRDRIVSQLFYANQHEILKAEEPDGKTFSFENTAVFGQLNLDVDKRELYRAWDHAYHTKIEEYVTPNGHKTCATQEIWPEKLPGILLFQIQRVRYDPKAKISVKLNTAFTFPRVLHGDRFLLKNKPIYLSLKDKLFSINSEMKSLEDELRHLNSFKDSGIALSIALDQVSRFLDMQQYSFVSSNKLLDSRIIEYNPKDIITTISTLDSYKKVIDDRKSLLESKIKELERELEVMYNLPELKEYEYSLHSILIHEGKAEMGHYYAYIYDWEEEVWRKYSDTLIKVVTTDEVMENAIGGNGEASAYCLIYIYKTFMENHGIIRASQITGERSGEKLQKLEKYATYLQNATKIKVLQENNKFNNEIDIHRVKKTVKRIKTIYDYRFSLLSTWTNEAYIEKKIEIINFPMFLRVNKNEILSRWVLLDCCIKEVIGKGIPDIGNNILLYNEIENVICRSTFGPKTLMINEFEVRSLNELVAAFKNKYFHAKMNIYVFEKLIEEDFIAAFQGIMYQIERIVDIFDEYQDVPIQMQKLLVIRVTSFINGCIYEKKIEQAVAWCKHLAFMVSTIGHDYESFIPIIRSRLVHSLDYLKKYLPSYYNIDLKIEFEHIFSSIDNLASNPTFDIENCDPLLKKILEDNSNPLDWIDTSNSIAWQYYKIQKKFNQSFIYSWVWIIKRIQEKNTVSEMEIKSIERNNGIIEKILW